MSCWCIYDVIASLFLLQVHVEFTGDYIIVDGQREAMELICHRLQNEVESLEIQKAFVELAVDSRYHKHVVGKNGTNIRQLCQGKNVQVSCCGILI